MKPTKAQRSRGKSHHPTPQLATLDELRLVVGRRIAAGRHRLGLSQYQLAVHVPCHQITITFFETSVITPSRKMMDKLAVALEMPLFELIRGPDPWELA